MLLSPPNDGTSYPACRLLALLSLLFCGGCGSPNPAATPDLLNREVWEIMYLQGTRAGYAQTTMSHETRDGRDVLKITNLNHLVVKRFGQDFVAQTRCTSIETPDGRLVEFQSELPQGQTPMRSTGRVQGDRLILEIATQGKTLKKTLPWSDQIGGPYAVHLSLLRAPLRPGEQRTISSFDPGVNEFSTTRLTARGYGQVDLPAGPQALLAVDTETTFAGQTMAGTIWMDRSGDVLKERLETLGMESVRATKAEALAHTQSPGFDLGLDVVVKVNRPLPSPHHTRRVRYRARLQNGDPSKLFVSCPSQQVRSIDRQIAEVTVVAVRPGSSSGNTEAAADPPAEDDLKPNSLIQSDDPVVVAMAREAAGDRKTPWDKAMAIERYVHDRMARSDFSQAFATAAEVARSRSGDCTEHAVLLAALARAEGIPARVAIGLVYYDQAFAYHMWTVVYVDGRWIPLDATLGQGGIGAAHLTVAQSNLKGAAPYSAFLPVLEVIGRLSIEIEDVQL